VLFFLAPLVHTHIYMTLWLGALISNMQTKAPFSCGFGWTKAILCVQTFREFFFQWVLLFVCQGATSCFASVCSSNLQLGPGEVDPHPHPHHRRRPKISAGILPAKKKTVRSKAEKESETKSCPDQQCLVTRPSQSTCYAILREGDGPWLLGRSLSCPRGFQHLDR